uniref:Uncharacterized protein n=1 Tax=uncultured Desulfobacterium sp. TaxID=201089 RepID=E1YAB1_9BACT|nr:unknown protein [uncultured Desulfobacterium sp.]
MKIYNYMGFNGLINIQQITSEGTVQGFRGNNIKFLRFPI